MADAKISALTAIDAVAAADLFAIVDDPAGTPVTKKATASQIKDYILGLANTWTATQTIDPADNTSALVVSGYSLTGSNAQSLVDLAGTWNTTGTPTAIKLNVTDTASNAASLLMDLQVGAATRFSVSKAGALTIQSGATLTADGATLYLNRSVNSSGSGTNSFSGSIQLTDIRTYGWADLFLTRRGAANLRLGAADATNDPVTPAVAQTLSVQSVATNANNTDRPGKDFTITGSQGTGTGAGGSIIFQVAPAGSSGTSQNALQNVFLLPGASGEARIVNSAGGSGTLVISSTANTNVAINFRFSTGTDGSGGSSSGFLGRISSSYGFFDASGTLIVGQPSGSSDSISIWGTDCRLARDAANTLALRNGTNAQTFNVYNTYTDASNYERGKIAWASNVLRIGTEKAGTGTARALELQSDGTTRLTIATNGNVTVATNLFSDLMIVATGFRGGSGTGDTYFYRQAANVWQIGREAQVTAQNGTLTVSKLSAVTDVAGGSLTLAGGVGRGAGGGGSLIFQTAPAGASGTTENTLADRLIIKPDGLLAFAGATSSFPALKRSSTTIQARLADDSAFASVQGKLTTETAYTAGAPTATGYIVLYDSTGTAYKVPAEAL